MSDRSVEFSVLCSMLEAIARSKKAAMKRKHIRTFLDHVYTDRQYFSALRLLLPSLDRERASYGLKEAILAKCLADALGLAKDSEDAQRLLNWRKGGARVGANAGNFPLIAAEILYRRQSVSSGDLKIKDMNDFLDKLATSESREEKTSVIAELIKNTNAQEMKWIIRIILKDLKLGIHEKAIFHEFHPDAEDLFNVTCDLKLVCEKLKDRTERFNRQDVEVGKAIRPQLALRVSDVDTAWKKLRGKQMAVECKFDGDRIQVHKDGSDVHFFSRNFIDHSEYSDAMANVFIQHVRIDKCILDGEMLVWDRLNNCFTEFGSNQSLAKAAKDGLETDQQLCYVAFDILYAGDGSVIHQSLRERREYLSKVVQPVKGQLELLHQHDDDPRWSIIASSTKDVEKFFLETVENRDEGIVIKDLDSKWEPGDRSGKWLKLKPDYINAGSDLDALIIGGYFGSGRRGGEVAQFLLGLAERPTPGAHPTRFVSFCKVGSGLTEDERSALVSKLKPYFRRYEKNAKAPSFYTVTNSSKERPDVWIEQPEKSVILEITSDIRTIKSEVFAAPYSLRFPRASRVRYDKPWYDCLDVKSLIEIVHSRSVSVTSANLYGSEKASKETKKVLRKRTKILPLVPSHLLMSDMSHVKQETSLFKGLLFYIVNCHPENTRDHLQKLIVENGGVLSMNMNGMVTHAIAAEKKGLKYEATAKQHTIVHQSWLTCCCKEQQLIPLRSRYLLNLSPATRLQMKDKIDDFGDYFFDDIEEDDLKQLYMNMRSDELTVGMDELDHYREKYCSISTSSQFLNCFGFFLSPFEAIYSDLKDIAQITLRRLQLEFIMHKGQVAKCLEDASHVVAYCEVQNQDPWEIIWRSLTPLERNMLKLKQVHIISHSWIEDALASGTKPTEEKYYLRGEFVDLDEDEKAPLEAYKPCKEKVEKLDSFTDVEVITPRRRLYSDIMTTEKGKAKVEDKIEYDVFKRLKKRRSSPMQNPKQQQVKDEIEVDLKLDLNITAEIEERKRKRISLVNKETKDSLEAMICDMIPVLNSSSDNVPNKEDSTKAPHHKKLILEENTVGPAPKKTRVSYKDLVGKFID